MKVRCVKALEIFVIRLKTMLPTLAAVGLKGAGALASFAVTFVLARTLGAAETGHYALAIATIGMVSPIALLGLDQIIVRTVAGDLREGHLERARAAIRQITRFVFLTSLAAASIVLLVRPLAPRIGLPVEFVLPIAVVVLAFPLLRVAYAGLRASGRLILSQLFDGVAYTGLVAMLALTVFLTQSRLGALTFTLAFAAAMYLSLALAWGLLWRSVRQWPTSLERRFPSLVTTGWPFFLATTAQALTEWTIFAQIGATGEPDEVGAFRVAYQVVLILALMAATVENLSGPGYAGDFRVGDLVGAKRRHRRATLAMAGIAIVPILLCLVFARPILAFFGPEFVQAAPALQIMAAAQAINVFTGPVGGFMLMSGRERQSMALGFAGLVFAVVIGFVLTPRFSATGAAFAYATAVIVRNAGSYFFVHRALRGVGP